MAWSTIAQDGSNMGSPRNSSVNTQKLLPVPSKDFCRKTWKRFLMDAPKHTKNIDDSDDSDDSDYDRKWDALRTRTIISWFQKTRISWFKRWKWKFETNGYKIHEEIPHNPFKHIILVYKGGAKVSYVFNQSPFNLCERHYIDTKDELIGHEVGFITYKDILKDFELHMLDNNYISYIIIRI